MLREEDKNDLDEILQESRSINVRLRRDAYPSRDALIPYFSTKSRAVSGWL